MQKIVNHPILEIPTTQTVTFKYEGKEISGEKGRTIASALHQAGYPVHSHSLKNRNRSLECGIGKCGACEMLVDGQIRRICITKIDEIKEIRELPKDFTLFAKTIDTSKSVNIYKTNVAIIGAGPAGLAVREVLNEHSVSNIVIDNNDEIGGQFPMQTHQFFFFEKEKKFGGMRGFDIARTLAGEDHDGIFLNSTVWDILESKRLAVKNILTEEIYYVEANYLVIATGAVPYMPAFKNDDVPGVYTAAVMQKMMNKEFTLLGKNILTIGAGNIGYLTSYQLMQAGANVKAIIEAQSHEGGFPVQANRIRRLGIPIILSHTLLRVIPNKEYNGITGAVIAQCENFKAIPGTERLVQGIDAINICTGLVSDDQLLIKGNDVFGRNCFGAGDAIRIGEGTSAVMRGKQVAFEILEMQAEVYNYNKYLSVSKEYIDSQQHPSRVEESPIHPSSERRQKPFVLIDCLYGFACNPCVFACTHGAISKPSTSDIPRVDFDKCVGCWDCIFQCPGLAIFGYAPQKDWVFLPVEFSVKEGTSVFLVDNNGQKLGKGTIETVLIKPNKTNIVRIKSLDIQGNSMTSVRGFIEVEKYPAPVTTSSYDTQPEAETYICHCDDVRLDEILEVVGDRKFISVDEIKHTTRLGMGACRGKRCVKRLKQTITSRGVSIVGVPTPRGPLSNQVVMGELYPKTENDEFHIFRRHRKVKKVKTSVLIAGGGIGGSALFRYLAEAGKSPILINYGHGSSWRNIAGGRPVFSVPELSDIASQNLEIFMELSSKRDIDFHQIHYVTFAQDEQMLTSLEASMKWQDAKMIKPIDFQLEISSHFNPDVRKYLGALKTRNCWQATPGKVIDLIRKIGIEKGGTVLEDCKLIDVKKTGNIFFLLVQDHNDNFIEYETEQFINALGDTANDFAKKIGIDCGLYPVKHQAFITRRLPLLGLNHKPLDMLIDRRNYKGFSAVYGQQLAETGQIIGCASPAVDAIEARQDMKTNSRDFLEIVSEVFIDWIPELSSVSFQAIWSGYYVEPRMIVDPKLGLFVGLRGQGFMLAQYLAKLYVDQLTGKSVPSYFGRLTIDGDGLLEKTFK